MAKMSTYGLLFFVFFDTSVLMAQKKIDSTSTFSATKSNGLLYQLDSGSMSYMLPYIELKLRNLRVAGKPDLLFHNVTSLETVIQTYQIKATLQSDLYHGTVIHTVISNDTIEKTRYEKFHDFMKEYQYLLLIKTNKLNNLLEFQFSLYKTSTTKDFFIYITNSNVFINPEKPHYQTDIVRALADLFVESRVPPEVNILPLGNLAKNEHYLSSKDSIKLEPLVTGNGSEDDLLYFWSNVDTDNDHFLHIDRSSKIQVLKNLKAGVKYHLQFSMSDGIDQSVPQDLYINVYEPPKLIASYGTLDGPYYIGANQLIIQRNLLNAAVIRLDSKLLLHTEKNSFKGEQIQLFVNIFDHSGRKILKNKFVMVPSKGLEPKKGDENIYYFAADNLLQNFKLNSNEHSDLEHLSSGEYTLSFRGEGTKMASDSLFQELVVEQIKPLALVFESSGLVIKYLNQVNYLFNIAMGANVKITNGLSLNALEGTTVTDKIVDKPFTQYFTNILFNGDLSNNNLGFGAGVIFPDNRNANFNVAFGGKFYVKLLNRLNGDLGVGCSFYTDFNHEQVFGIHFYHSFFLKK